MKTTPNDRLSHMTFGSLYPLYLAKIERKGRTKADLDLVLCWLTGNTQKELENLVASPINLEHLFADVSRLNPHRTLITGRICGVRVEDIEDPLMREIRYMDKLVDELAQGKALEKILRK